MVHFVMFLFLFFAISCFRSFDHKFMWDTKNCGFLTQIIHWQCTIYTSACWDKLQVRQSSQQQLSQQKFLPFSAVFSLFVLWFLPALFQLLPSQHIWQRNILAACQTRCCCCSASHALQLGRKFKSFHFQEKDQPGHKGEGEAGIQLTPLETWEIPQAESLRL